MKDQSIAEPCAIKHTKSSRKQDSPKFPENYLRFRR